MFSRPKMQKLSDLDHKIKDEKLDFSRSADGKTERVGTPGWFGVSPNLDYEAGVGAPWRDL